MHINAPGGQPPILFLVLRELIPIRDETALLVDGFELDEQMRMIRRRNIYLRRSDGIEAHIPRWRVGNFEADEFDESDDSK